MLLINNLVLTISLSLISLSSLAATAPDEHIKNLISNLGDYQSIVIMIAFVIGVFLLWGVFNSLKTFSDNGSQESVGSVLTRLAVAFGFIAFGFLMTSISP